MGVGDRHGGTDEAITRPFDAGGQAMDLGHLGARERRRHRRTAQAERGRQQMGSGPRRYAPPPRPAGQLNTTDPDAKRMKQGRAFAPPTTPRRSQPSSRS